MSRLDVLFIFCALSVCSLSAGCCEENLQVSKVCKKRLEVYLACQEEEEMQLADLFAQLTQVNYLNCEEMPAIMECATKKWLYWRNICDDAKDDWMNCWLNDKSCSKLAEENDKQLNDVNEKVDNIKDEIIHLEVIDSAEESNKNASELFESEKAKLGLDTKANFTAGKKKRPTDKFFKSGN